LVLTYNNKKASVRVKLVQISKGGEEENHRSEKGKGRARVFRKKFFPKRKRTPGLRRKRRRVVHNQKLKGGGGSNNEKVSNSKRGFKGVPR